MVPPGQIACNCFFGAVWEEWFGCAYTDHALKAGEVSSTLWYYCAHMKQFPIQTLYVLKDMPAILMPVCNSF